MQRFQDWTGHRLGGNLLGDPFYPPQYADGRCGSSGRRYKHPFTPCRHLRFAHPAGVRGPAWKQSMERSMAMLRTWRALAIDRHGHGATRGRTSQYAVARRQAKKKYGNGMKSRCPWRSSMRSAELGRLGHRLEAGSLHGSRMRHLMWTPTEMQARRNGFPP